MRDGCCARHSSLAGTASDRNARSPIGDCAKIPDPYGGFFPPTAQHALREGKKVASNISAVLSGREPAAFTFSTIGVLCLLGHRTAAAEIKGRRFSGLLAWFLWRGIYLAKLRLVGLGP